ncbi:MAG: HU family DNA-binding protein [Candidatus Buchananbacteria bacterium]
MNKAELIETISSKANVSKKEVEEVIDTMLETITEKIKGGDEVTLTGFGAFSARTRKGRIGVNPRNPSEKIEIHAVTVPKFKAGKNLKESLKGKAAKISTPPAAESTEPAAAEEPATPVVE